MAVTTQVATTSTKSMDPSVTTAHEEKVHVDPPTHNESFIDFQAYEARTIDLRTVLGLLVCCSVLSKFLLLILKRLLLSPMKVACSPSDYQHQSSWQ